jgi:S1-C subfamily serine protease
MWLTIEVPSQEPLVVEVADPVTTIGSDPGCDILIADPEISPRHAELRKLADGRLEIEDLDSGSGTWVGGVRLGGPATLEGGERLRIGRTELISSLERPDPSEPVLTRRENLQRLVTQSRRATLLAVAAVAIAGMAVVLAATGTFSGGGNAASGDAGGGLSPAEIIDLARPGTALVVALGAGQRNGIGTGWVLDADEGLIVTNAHVVDAGETFQVGTQERLGDAEVVGVAPCEDLAVLRTDETEGLESLTLGAQDSLSQGDQVVAVGYPTNASPDDELQATQGIVSVVEQTFDIPNDPFVQLYENVIQTDAPINPGNSGGPLIDSEGNLVGVNTLVFRGRRGEIEGQGYAIGVDRVSQVIPDLREGDSQAWTGFAFQALPAAEAARQGVAPGLLVTTVVPGTPADDEGLVGGRAVVVGVDGEPVESFREYCDAVDGKNGETVEFNLLEPSGSRIVELEL